MRDTREKAERDTRVGQRRKKLEEGYRTSSGAIWAQKGVGKM